MWPLLLLAGAVGFMAHQSRGKKGGKVTVTSDREDEPEAEKVDDKRHDDVSAVLLSQLGVPYVWGGTKAGQGFDCSGFCSWALVATGQKKTYKRYTARTLADACNPVKWGEQRPGDMVYYPGHVVMVLSDPDSDGDSEIIGANGGRSGTNAADPKDPLYGKAKVKVYGSMRYRKDFVCIMRLKPSEAG